MAGTPNRTGSVEVAGSRLIGKPYSTADLVAKVTGQARYAEDFRAEGMLFAKLLTSPMPHGRVRRIDTSAAEALPGVAAILTADDLPAVEAPNERALTNEPLYEGEPILAVAAVDETMAADAVERIVLDLEPLPFVLDPLDSLRPGGPNARLDGNTMTGTTLATIKWDGADWAAILQAVSMMAPMMHKAAKQLNVDPLEMIRINAPEGQAFGPPRQGARPNVSSAFVREAAEAGAAAFDWPGMRAKSGRRDGTRVTGIGVALSAFTAGASGMDGPLTIRPDGKVYIQQGIGSLGTKSVFDTARAAMEVLDTDWDQAEVIWGNTSKHLPWSAIQAGAMTTHALTRSNHAAGKDAKRKLQEIAARDLGDSPDDYDVSDGRVFRRGNRSQGLGFAQAARRAVELGGRSTGAATAAWRPTRSLFERGRPRRR